MNGAEYSKILLHCCCAVCATYPIQHLKNNGFDPVLFFFNPNIFPETEHNRRLQELSNYCIKNNLPLFVENSSHQHWLESIKGFENEPEKGKRCTKCFELRLEETAKMANKLNIECFTTTLSISPHKNSDQIFQAAQNATKQTDATFLPFNFKKKDGFKIANQIAKQENFYRQNYCGCEFSKEC